MIKVTELIKSYNGLIAVNIPSLIIEKGESFGLVGNNGAGKTTFFRLILDLVRPDSGEVLSNSVDVKKTEEWKKYTGSYLDESFLIDFLTPEEYFHFIAKLNSLSAGDLNEFYSDFDDFFNGEIIGRNKLIRDLSQGNRKKVGIAAALMIKPSILILDEPFANIDPSTQIRLKKMLNDHKEKHDITMLISSHDLLHITEVCERIVILEKSEIVKDLETNQNTLKELETYFTA
ncbi:ABC transporter ATP-binding protein [Bacteroidota bacterium]